MEYDPHDPADRLALAQALTSMLATAGFEKLDGPAHAETVFRYKAPAGAEILVYSSIVGCMVRGDGEDAIRVAAVYRRRDGETRGLYKATRVNRTGEIGKIVERTRQRMREAYKGIRDRYSPVYMCKDCGAWLFTSKGGKLVCAETCWVK